MQWINSEMFVKSVGYFYVPFNIMMKKKLIIKNKNYD